MGDDMITTIRTNRDGIDTQTIEEKEIALIIEKYELELKYLAFRYLRNWSLVDDVLQEVYLKLFLNLDLINQQTIKHWLYTTTRNQCLDYLRNKHLKYTTLVETPEDLQKVHYPSAETTMIEQLEEFNLRQGISTLPPKYRNAIELFYINELTCREISLLLNLNICTIRSRLHRGRKLLREIILNNTVFDIE
ncbi:RNA polymerase sigma factor [Sutcliffiella cohnii]|uniref:RNA polymerase sigma factor n=1 Tax=Sutcliffiella cohnii TaxID=33932 RepID=UPI002E1E20A2|nr:sigma-70 family RNA polymerase sigma factor [Sutcliffiella cohnii]